jgi:hypothetical protein
MHRSEGAELVPCADCGAEIASGRDRSYACDDERELCFACALRRGGVYDEGHDAWSRPPVVADLIAPQQALR